MKQLIYGLLYFGVIGGGAYGIYAFSTREPAPSCFDNIKNRDEAEIDCSAGEGGTCIPCELKNIKIAHGEIKSLPVGEDATTFVLEISNPSQNYGLARFDYSLDVYSKFSPLARKIYNSASLYPGESKLLIESGIDLNPDEVGKIEFTVYEPAWQKADELPAKQSVRISSVAFRLDELSATVSGRVENISSQEIASLILGALGYRDGEIYRAGTQEIKNLAPREGRSFTIFLPRFNYTDVKVHANILPN